MPIYYVIATAMYSPALPYQVYTIRKVFECDLSELNDIYLKEVAPLYDQGAAVYPMVYAREPSNPFKTFGQDNAAAIAQVWTTIDNALDT